MTAAKLYRAVPLAGLGKAQGEVTVLADSVVDALDLAKIALGEGVAFDLCDGAAIVLTYRPTRRWREVERGQKRE